MQAMPKILEACPDVELDLVGPTSSLPYEYLVMISNDEKVSGLSVYYPKGLKRLDNYFESLQASLSPDMAKQVNFIGQVPHANIMSYYQHADVLINPSLSESFGISLIEAMANGRPVVASRVGGMQEIVIEGETGLFFEPGDADALAESAITLLENPEIRKSMGMAGRRRVQEIFSWDHVTQDLLQQYTRTLESED
jgi:glycosyltransferase involved in cell wall biosynthesis